MSTIHKLPPPDDDYPEDDGLPIAENTLQFDWIVTINFWVESLYYRAPDVLVASDLLWYPVQGDNTIRQAPDTLVAIGRPKGHRRSYQQWKEGGVAPQVVFEIQPPGDRAVEMQRKLEFYERYQVEEYYIFTPDRVTLDGYRRAGEILERIPKMDGWISPRMDIRFDLSGGELRIYRPNGERFLTYVETIEEIERNTPPAVREQRRAIEERVRAVQLRTKYWQRAEKLAAQLRALGIEPEA